MENNIPKHIAIIMDGNGRWAARRGLPRVMGHRAGAKSVRKVVEACARMKVKYLTLYAFSVDNWKRPPSEVAALMRYLNEFLQKETNELMKHDIKLAVTGRLRGLPDFVRKRLLETIRMTSKNKGLVLVLALNYGGRREIVDACRKLGYAVKKGKIKPHDIDEKRFSEHLYTPSIPDPDLLIRTSGEYRLSNFLLWQASYSELYISGKLWPDFGEADLVSAVEDYRRRERRFGALQPKRGDVAS